MDFPAVYTKPCGREHKQSTLEKWGPAGSQSGNTRSRGFNLSNNQVIHEAALRVKPGMPSGCVAVVRPWECHLNQHCRIQRVTSTYSACRVMSAAAAKTWAAFNFFCRSGCFFFPSWTRCGSDRRSQNGQTLLKWLARPAFLPHRRIWSEGSLEISLWTPKIKEWLHTLACDKYESHCIKLYHNLMCFHIVRQEVTQKMKWKYFPTVCLKMAQPCCWHNV